MSLQLTLGALASALKIDGSGNVKSGSERRRVAQLNSALGSHRESCRQQEVVVELGQIDTECGAYGCTTGAEETILIQSAVD